MAFLAYSPRVYNSLGNFPIVTKMEDQVRGVGKIILKYGYENDVCVIPAHRHFDLDENEVMLEFSAKNSRISKPIKNEKLDVIDAYPTTLFCAEYNGWYPVAYGFGENNVARVWNNSTFLYEVGVYLFKNGNENKIMLGEFDKNLENKNGFHYIEKNYEDARTTKIVLSNDKDVLENTYVSCYYFIRNYDVGAPFGFEVVPKVYFSEKLC